MDIFLEKVGKKFNNEWIFKNINLELKEEDNFYTFIGRNGSGKSTLLQVLLGNLSQSEGKIRYRHQEKNIPVEEIYKYISFAAPYLELVEELTLLELVAFHLNFKTFKDGLGKKEFIDILGLEKSKDKPVKFFSSGMKQRVKLGLAFYSDTPMLFLDEPTSNLDKQGIEWYHEEIERNTKHRLCVIASNQIHEYGFCKNVFDMRSF